MSARAIYREVLFNETAAPWGPAGQEKPGVLDTPGEDPGSIVDHADHSGHFLSRAHLREQPPLSLDRLPIVPDAVRLKFIAVGLNYSDHAAATGQASTKEPILFAKANARAMSQRKPH